MSELSQPRSHRHFYYSLLLHIIILTILVVSFQFSSMTPVLENSDKPNEIINATVLDTPKALPPKKILPKPEPLPKPQVPIVKQQNPEPKPKEIPIQKQAIVIPDKKQEKPKQDLIQKQLLADLQKQKQHQKKLKQKAIENDFAKEMQNIKAQSLQQQMLQEQKRVAGLKAQQLQGIVDKYKALILQAISQKWIIPAKVDKNLYAELLIHLAPGGVVLDVQITKSSGTESLDRSARTAVFKASPLPVPTEAEEFEPFRQFILKVKPENILGNES